MIRHLTIADASAVHLLNTVTEMGNADLEATASTLTRILQHPDQHVLFAFEVDGQVFGYIHAQIYEMLYSPNVLFNVIALAIDARHQGKGIGKQLLLAIEQEAMALGMDGIRINSGNNREQAHAFYEKLGYVSNRDQKRYVKRFMPVY